MISIEMADSPSWFAHVIELGKETNFSGTNASLLNQRTAVY